MAQDLVINKQNHQKISERILVKKTERFTGEAVGRIPVPYQM